MILFRIMSPAYGGERPHMFCLLQQIQGLQQRTVCNSSSRNICEICVHQVSQLNYFLDSSHEWIGHRELNLLFSPHNDIVQLLLLLKLGFAHSFKKKFYAFPDLSLCKKYIRPRIWGFVEKIRKSEVSATTPCHIDGIFSSICREMLQTRYNKAPWQEKPVI